MCFVKNINMPRDWFIRIFFLNILRLSACGLCTTCVCSFQAGSQIADCHEKIKALNNTIFSNLFILEDQKPLNHLILSKNEIFSLPRESLNSLKRLRTLDLSENIIDTINIEEFNDLNNLSNLNVSHNKLELFDGGLLDVLPSLTMLNISWNYINSLLPSTKNSTSNLEVLDVSHNNLRNLNTGFFELLPNLQYLDASFNKINALNVSSVTYFQQLKVLRLVDNGLLSLYLPGLSTTLEKLYVGFNMLTSLPYEIQEVEVLSIERNSISKLDNEVEKFTQLKHLNLSGNLLKDVPNIVLNELKNLDVSYNDLPEISHSFAMVNFPQLEALDISGNPMQKINFPVKIRLVALNIDNLSALKEIHEDSFINIETPNNQCMNLSISKNNHLSVIHEKAFQSVNTCFLDLSYNRLNYISQNLISREKKLNMKMGVDLQGNPFHCNCSLQWILDDLLPQLYDVNRKLLDNLRCKTPSAFHNKRMVHWYNWKERVYCEDISIFYSKMTVTDAEESISDTVTYGSTTGFLVVLSISITIFTIFVVIGIVLTHKLVLTKRRRNRRL